MIWENGKFGDNSEHDTQIELTGSDCPDPGGRLITLDGVNSTRLFQVDPGASLDHRNITLARGQDSQGGAIRSGGVVTVIHSCCATIVNSMFSGNQGAGLANLNIFPAAIHNILPADNSAHNGSGSII